MRWQPRHGQWVRFQVSLPAPEQAHRSADGLWLVGIYQRAGKDSLGQFAPARVVPVDGRGRNLAALTAGGLVGTLAYPVGRHVPLPDGAAEGGVAVVPVPVVTELEPALSRDDIPAERLRHAPPGWTPRA